MKRYVNKKLIKQKLLGIASLAASVAIILMAMSGKTAADQDATAVLVTLPMGLLLLCSKEIIID